MKKFAFNYMPKWYVRILGADNYITQKFRRDVLNLPKNDKGF